MREMPLLSLDHLTVDERKIADRLVAGQGKNKGRLRASKPDIAYTIVEKDGRKYREPSKDDGLAAYLWRIVAFAISPIHQHQCLPVCADFDLPYFTVSREDQKRLADDMKALCDKIVSKVPIQEQHGYMRWAKALHG